MTEGYNLNSICYSFFFVAVKKMQKIGFKVKGQN